MSRKFTVWMGMLGSMLVLGLFSAALVETGSRTSRASLRVAKADPAGVNAAFRNWTAGHEASGGDRNVQLRLGWSKGMSRELSYAEGVARLDLVGGAAQVEIDGLDAGEWDVWMVENRPDSSALPDAGDRIHRLGRLAAGQGTARLAAHLGAGFFSRFQADTVVVTRAGQRPENAGVLFGSPDLFQRLYTKGRTQPELQAGHTPLLASLFGPSVAVATPFDSLDPLVAKGADLFFNEKFNGNGRTCGTCHPAENNFTLDPGFIKTLPPNNALFVAEFDPNLAANFEKPQLMRALGLILENVDGFDNLPTKFVLRGVPHTLALLNSRLREAGSPAPVERLGWGGDGSVGSGTLRDFAVGAIIQHFPKTLNRVSGVDFRVPTNDELDAMAAFQLALGRQAELNLSTMVFRSPVISRGRDIFNAGDTVGGTVAAGKCAACHANGGSNSATTGENVNRDIGVERLPDHPADLIAPGVRRPDGGFLRNPRPDGSFGNGRFNSPTLVEAADTGPFFHNNVIDTIEGAVEFYNSNAFKVAFGNALATVDTGGIGIHLESTQVESVAGMLRVLNALENIRSSSELDEASFDLKDKGQANRLLTLASHDTKDAIQVLQDRSLHPNAVSFLTQAYYKELEAANENSRPKRDDLIVEILTLKVNAWSDMLISPTPPILPPLGGF